MKRAALYPRVGSQRYDAGRLRAALARAANWWQFARFAAIGASGYVLNLVLFSSLVALGIDYRLAAVSAFLVAVTNNFVLNSRFTFAAHAGRPSHQAPRFLFVSLMAFLLSLSVLEVGVAVLGLPKVVAQILATGLATPVNFVGNKIWTFGGGRSHAR